MSSMSSFAARRRASRCWCCTAVPGRDQPVHAPLLRFGAVPHRTLRPARHRPFAAARVDRGQHHLAPGRGHRADPRRSRDRPLAALRRLLGVDPGAALRPAPPGPGDGAGAARPVHHDPVRARLVLRRRRGTVLPRGLGRVHRTDPRGRALRPGRRLSRPPDRRRRGGAERAGPALGPVGDRHRSAAPQPRRASSTRLTPAPSPGSKATTSSIAAGSRRTARSCATCTGSPASPG